MAAVDPKKILGLLRKFWVTAVAGVVLLGGALVPFLVVSGWNAEYLQKLESRRTEHDSLDSLRNSSRQLPQLDPDSTEAKPLAGFPNEAVITAAEAGKKRLEGSAAEIVQYAVTLNRKEPLHPRVFDWTIAPTERAVAEIQFKTRYAEMMLGDPTVRPPTPPGINAIIHGAYPPTQEQITSEVRLAQLQVERTQAVRVEGKVINEAEVKRAVLRIDRERPMEIRLRTAQSNQVYLTPGCWQVATDLTSSTAPRVDPRTQWMAQVGFWMQEEVARAIVEANTGSKSVLESPVKHLLRITFQTNPPSPYVVGNNGISLGVAPVTGLDPAAAFTPSKLTAYTGRVATGLYDVVHMTVVVRTTAEGVSGLLNALSNNRLMTVLKVDLLAIDNVSAATEGYLYGDQPMVELKIELEMLFLRSWSEPLMPQVMKEQLGIKPPAMPQ